LALKAGNRGLKAGETVGQGSLALGGSTVADLILAGESSSELRHPPSAPGAVVQLQGLDHRPLRRLLGLIDLVGKRQNVRSITLELPIKAGRDEWLAAAKVKGNAIFREVRQIRHQCWHQC
jgi:hypothetical protein